MRRGLGSGSGGPATPDAPAPEVTTLVVRPRPGRCPACAHEAARSARAFLGRARAARPATCRVSDGVDDPSGWPTECGCTDAFHGS